MIEGHEDPHLPMMAEVVFEWDLRDDKQMDASECAGKFIREVSFDKSVVDHAIGNLNAMRSSNDDNLNAFWPSNDDNLNASGPSNDDCDCNKEGKTNSEPIDPSLQRKELEKAIDDYQGYCDAFSPIS